MLGKSERAIEIAAAEAVALLDQELKNEGLPLSGQLYKSAVTQARVEKPLAEHRRPTKEEAEDKGIDHTFMRGSTNAEYLTRRLARDFPEIAQQLVAGEFKSPRAAAAGIVRDPAPLDSDERTAQTLRYAAALKESGHCATLTEVRASAGAQGGKVAQKTSKVSTETLLPPKPSVIQATATGLSISETAVKLRAHAAGKTIGESVSLEKDSPEKLRRVADQMQAKATTKRVRGRAAAPRRAGHARGFLGRLARATI